MAAIVGVAGTAKNTGKTTTTAELLKAAVGRNLNIGLTSIGYDGEEVDNITGLPKPRITLKEGTIVATARKCLLASTAKFEVLVTTDIMTPLGRLYIVRIIQEGLVVTAGPNKSNELRQVLEKIQQVGNCDLIIVDGALNRIAPMVETSGIILATGAAKTTNIELLMEETRAFNNIFSLEECSQKLKNLLADQEKITFAKKRAIVKELKYGFMIDKNFVAKIASFSQEYDILYIPALVTYNRLKELNSLMNKSWEGKTLLIRDPTKLAVGGKPEEMMNLVHDIQNSGAKVMTIETLPLLAVTVNPFYPRFRYDSRVYQAKHVDKVKLKYSIEQVISAPVFNIKDDGPEELLDILI